MKNSIGISAKPPGKACDDVKCAWHGRLPIRGKVFEGVVRSTKPRNTAIVEWDYHRFITKYERYQREKSRVNAHNPPCMHAREGERVVIAECRPLSKTKSFVVVQVQGGAPKKVAKRKKN
ncbi:MAG: 30S ribosomal protein S17 [Candidatus Aenigmarchaeota archaeon]|nr:30S ribosomal protein S17 [Candidatus Aenigmarchaeota archaeon]